MSVSRRYNLKLVRYDNGIKESLHLFNAAYPHITAVFMGSRRSDPNCENMTPFEMTDAGWPPLMRINPILDWSYADVWLFLKKFGFEYCRLYTCG